MSIVAALDKVLFFNASSKYSVLRMKTEDSSVPAEARSPYRYHDHLIRFTAVGIELPQTDTVKIEMDGEWKDGKYGLQLQVDHWQEIVPPTLEGIRNYLASGLLKGIGEKTADAIIEKFGINALEILEHQPDRLLEIRGITKERLAEIKDAYAETSRMRVLMTLLAPFKVTPTTAQKIYQHFGPSCADIVRQSPFNLCQVPGFGFKRIDAIVQKSGGDLRDPKRVHGALFYALEDARTKDGHLYLEAEALLKAAMQLLNERIPLPQMRVPMSQVEQELSAMIRQDEVVSNHGNVYLPKQFLQESETAQKAVELFLANPAVVDIAQPLERVKHSLGLNLSKRQSEGVEMVFRHNLSIITGGPGTGKTTVLKTVIEVYRQLYPRQKIVLGAPTGKASRRMAEATGIDEAQTLHSILGLHGDSESKKDRERKPLEAGLLIVDETSMVDMWLIHQLFLRLRPGTKVLLVGDADQLESVGAGDVFHELIGSGVVPVTVLDEIFRQAQDSLIAHNARFINEGKTTLYYGEDFAFHKAESQEETAGIIRELYREQIAAKGIEQVEILSPFRSEGEASVNSLNEAIREEINPAAPETPEIVYAGIIFRLNDRVMQMRNNYEIKLYTPLRWSQTARYGRNGPIVSMPYAPEDDADGHGKLQSEEFLGRRLGVLVGVPVQENIAPLQEGDDIYTAEQVSYSPIDEDEWLNIVYQTIRGKRQPEVIEDFYAFGFEGNRLAGLDDAAATVSLDELPAPEDMAETDALLPSENLDAPNPEANLPADINDEAMDTEKFPANETSEDGASEESLTADTESATAIVQDSADKKLRFAAALPVEQVDHRFMLWVTDVEADREFPGVLLVGHSTHRPLC